MQRANLGELSLGIIGRGNFASLLKEILGGYFREVYTIDKDSSPTERLKVFKSDIVVIGVTLDSYESVLVELKSHLDRDSLLVDVCSVKLKPSQLIKKSLPNHKNLLITHPLFGPKSASIGHTKGLKIVICEESGSLATRMVELLEVKLGLEVNRITALEHDKIMSHTHSLTFFIAEALKSFRLDQYKVTTPSFDKLLALSHTADDLSDKLLASIQQDNPFSISTHKEFIKQVENLSARLDY